MSFARLTTLPTPRRCSLLGRLWRCMKLSGFVHWPLCFVKGVQLRGSLVSALFAFLLYSHRALVLLSTKRLWSMDFRSLPAKEVKPMSSRSRRSEPVWYRPLLYQSMPTSIPNWTWSAEWYLAFGSKPQTTLWRDSFAFCVAPREHAFRVSRSVRVVNRGRSVSTITCARGWDGGLQM